MTTRYSKTTGTFYPLDIDYPNLPADVVEVSKSDFDTAMSRPLGNTFDFVAGVLVITPPAPATRAQVQAAQWEKIKAERDRRQSGGYLVASKWYHSDDGSRIQQLGLLMMGASIPANLQWKTMDGTFVTMTQALASQVFAAAATSDQTIFAKAEAHKTAMIAATDPASYNFLTGWPLVYGE
jgi:hypothetical protein